MTLSGTVTQAALRTDFDQFTTRINTRMVAGAADFNIFARRDSLDDTDDLSLRSVAWTQPDDAEVRVLRAECTHTTTGRTVTAKLYADNDPNNDYIGGSPLEVTRASINGNIISSLDLRTTSGRRVMLLRGVRYRLEVGVDAGAAITAGIAEVLLRARRRTR